MIEARDQYVDDPKQGFIALVSDLAAASGPDGLSLGEIRDRMDERAFGLMILILAIPCLVPALYGVPQIVGIPILILAGQMLAGPGSSGWRISRPSGWAGSNACRGRA
jgi:hypothetical protein